MISEDQLKVFLEAVKADASLNNKLNSSTDGDELVAIAKEAGFSVTIGELSRNQVQGIIWRSNKEL